MAVKRQKYPDMNGLVRYFDYPSRETLRCEAPIWLKENWLGSAVLDDGTTRWTFAQVSAAGTDGEGGPRADVANGVYRLETKSASDELAIARVDWADQLLLNPAKGIIFEARVAPVTLAPFAATELVIGLASAHNNAWNSVAEHAAFKLIGATCDVVCESDDGTTDHDDKGTPYAGVAATYRIYRIEKSV